MGGPDQGWQVGEQGCLRDIGALGRSQRSRFECTTPSCRVQEQERGAVVVEIQREAEAIEDNFRRALLPN